MTIADVRERVAAIAEMARNDAAAHAAEDDLHGDVLTAIAQGAPDAAEMAREALRTWDIEFSRWYE